MAIVNPYLKQKKPGAGRNAGALASTRIPTGTRTRTRIPTPPTSLASGSTTHGPIGTNTVVTVHDTTRPRNENVHTHVPIRRASQAAPTPRVTPNGKQKTTVTQTGKSLGSSSSNRIGTSTTQALGKAGVSSSIATTTTAASSTSKTLRPTTRSKKSVKQRLKQEIAALRKQKQLQTLQRETEQRLRLRRTERVAQEERRRIELARRTAEQQRKKAERERLRAAKQNEKIRRQREKEQRRLEKEQEKERKQEEKQLREEQKLREQRARAEAKYQSDLRAWKNHQQRWMEQQQRIHFFQQQQQEQKQQQQQQQQQQYWHFHHQQQQQQKIHTVSHNPQQLDPHVHFSRNEDRHPRPVHPKTGFNSPPPSPQTPLCGAVQTESEAVPDGTSGWTLDSDSALDSTPVSPLDSPTALAIEALIDAGDWMSPKRLVEASDDADDGAGSVGVASSTTVTTTITTETKPMALGNDNQDVDLKVKASDSLSVENPSISYPTRSLPSSTLEDPKAESSTATACPRNGGTDCPSAGESLPSPLPSPLSLSQSSSLPPRTNEEPVAQKPERAAPSNPSTTTTTTTTIKQEQQQRQQHPFPRPPQYVAPNHPVATTTCYQPTDSRGPMTILPHGSTSITSKSGMLAPRAVVLPPQSWHSTTATTMTMATATMPVYPTSVVWNAQNYHNYCYGMQHSASLAWIPPPPPPPQPPVLWQTSRAVVRRPRPRAPRAMKKAEQAVLLCKPLEPPSPFANHHHRDNNRYLLTILVVRDPRTENSFGVNLKLHTESALVDPAWIEAQQKQKQSSNYSSNNNINNKSNSNSNSKGQPNPKRDEGGTPSATSGIQTKATGAPKKAGTIGTPVAEQHPSPPSVRLPPKGPTESSGTDPPAENTGAIPSVPNQSKTELAAESAVRGQNVTNPKGDTGDYRGTSNPTNEQPVCRSNSKNDEDAADAKSVVKKCLEDLVSSIENGQKGTNKTAGTVPFVQKRKRRRRVNFSVMMVTDAERQNARRPDVDSNEKLGAGDIVVAVQGHDLHGMSFRDACAVFSREADVVSDSLVQTRLVVARKKESIVPIKAEIVAKPPPPKATPVPSSGTTAVHLPPPANSSMVFSPAEIATLSNCFFQMLHSTKRVLGQDIPDTLWQTHTTIFQMGSILKDTALTPREITTLKNKWMDLARLMDYGMVEKGKSYWSKKFREEFGTESIPFSSDVERHAMRHLPRPSKGCRCKHTDHEYVSDPKCVLYSDLQKRLSTEELAELRQHKKSKYVPDSSKELNAVESAFKNRMLKLKTETENESIEARFVDKMEEIQVKELHKAVFAPNLTTIVLSTIFELRREFRISVEEDEEDNNNDERANDNTNEEDDDVPLECLGKRKPDGETENQAKKQHKLDREGGLKFCMKYLIRMVDFVSKTWGHCYREADTDEYAWRWELFHAVHSDHDHWEAHATNPRTTGSFPFENVRFGLNGSRSISNELSTFSKSVREFEDSVLSDSPSTLSISNEILDQFCLAVHVLSPARSGLYDELIALLKMGIIKVSTSGIPVLTDDWWTKVDIVVLDDMITSWSTKTDPDSRHCVNEELRDTLEEQWVKSDNGWSSMENPKELIFDYTILDEWRETFEGRLEQKADISEGIGLFGL